MSDAAPAVSLAKRPADVMKKLVALCKQRGFVFQSSEIYGGLKSAYDYGPLGAELKRNLMGEWWKDMVTTRENVVGIDASIIMHPNVWRASGHAAGFSDPLVDCKVSKERFRADKAPRPAIGSELPITCPDKGVAKDWADQIEKNFGIVMERDGNVLSGVRAISASEVGFFPKGASAPTKTWPWRGYVSPTFGSAFLTNEKQFNLMFRTSLGPVDQMGDIATVVAELTAASDMGAAVRAKFGKACDDGALQKALAVEPLDRARVIRAVMEQLSQGSLAYLRPETAQAMFVQFKNVMDSAGLKPPFGIAQMGKSFRNEVTVEHFIFRSCEFEQMEMEFFCEPGTQKEWMAFWKEARMSWWRRFANYPEDFVFRQHAKDEMAFYADDCYDVEYKYPWGFGELEGIASRTDYDLTQHEKHSGVTLQYVDQEKADPKTGAKPWKYKPYVIEPAAGATRAVLCFLLDAYHEEERTTATGEKEIRTVLKLHPKLAPIKCAVLPLVKKDGMPEKAREIISALLKAGVHAKYDEKASIGKRYAKHDEIGTPYCITVDGDTLTADTVTLRDRDTTLQVRLPIAEVVKTIKERLEA
ncbi:MAG TPA: glycine--tRNA ligase [Planctomycetota bacterium]|nr:glycine--tRNA ligase [Planctomycetota bacterium]